MASQICGAAYAPGSETQVLSAARGRSGSDPVARHRSPWNLGMHAGLLRYATYSALLEDLLSPTQIALEARQTASATLGSLQEQGNQLKRVNRDVDDVRSLFNLGSGP